MGNLKDSQRSAVYRWEDTIFLSKFGYSLTTPKPSILLSLQECQSISAEIWDHFFPGTNGPEIVPSNNLRSSARAFRDSTIKLPKWSRSRGVVCHETAHAIMYRWISELESKGIDLHHSGHGPRFATLVSYLYFEFCDIPMIESMKRGVMQKPRRVAFAKPMDTPQPSRSKSTIVKRPLSQSGVQLSLDF